MLGRLGVLHKSHVQVINKGRYVADDVVVGLIAEHLRTRECAGGFVLDGFPRTLQQAKKVRTTMGGCAGHSAVFSCGS